MVHRGPALALVVLASLSACQPLRARKILVGDGAVARPPKPPPERPSQALAFPDVPSSRYGSLPAAARRASAAAVADGVLRGGSLLHSRVGGSRRHAAARRWGLAHGRWGAGSTAVAANEPPERIRVGDVVRWPLGGGTAALLCVEQELEEQEETSMSAVFRATHYAPEDIGGEGASAELPPLPLGGCNPAVRRRPRVRDLVLKQALGLHTGEQQEREAWFMRRFWDQREPLYARCFGRLEERQVLIMQPATTDLGEYLYSDEPPESWRPFSLEIMYNFTEQLLRGLARMHESGHAHRKIALDNLLVDCVIGASSCRLFIADFALACNFAGSGDFPCTKMVTPPVEDYAPPEMKWAGVEQREVKQDMWAAGVVLDHMLVHAGRDEAPKDEAQGRAIRRRLRWVRRLMGDRRPAKRCVAAECLDVLRHGVQLTPGRVVVISIGIGRQGALCVEKEVGEGSEGAVFRASLFRSRPPARTREGDRGAGHDDTDSINAVSAAATAKCKGKPLAGSRVLETTVAVKQAPGGVSRLYEEADNMMAFTGLHNRQLVEFIAYDSRRDLLVMEFVEESLYDFLERDGLRTLALAARFTRQLLVGLLTLHEAGFAHRDIKLWNLLVDCSVANGCDLRIADFGFACRLPCRRDSAYTKGYEPPEFNDTRIYRADKHDVYSAGVVLGQMLSVFDRATVERERHFVALSQLEKWMTNRVDKRCSVLKCLYKLVTTLAP